MRFQHLFAASVGTLAVALASCSSDVRSACSDYIRAIGDASERCSGHTYDDEVEAMFVDLCEAQATAPGTSAFTDQLDACVDAIDGAACSALLQACSLEGSLPDGAACGAGSQCAGGDCDRSGGTKAPNTNISCGVCASYLAVGAACASSGSSCEPGSTCSGEPGTCVPYPKEGEACTTICGYGLSCDIETQTCRPVPTKGEACQFSCREPFVCAAGTCIDRVPVGGACPAGNECEQLLICNTMHLCAEPKHVAEGETCTGLDGDPVVCDDGLGCDFESKKCVKAKAKGSSCDPAEYGSCGELLACVNGTCQVPDYGLCGK